MKIYRAHQYDPVEGSLGFKWFALKKMANQQQKAWNNEYGDDHKVSEFEITFNRYGIANFLNAHCNYPDNG